MIRVLISGGGLALMLKQRLIDIFSIKEQPEELRIIVIYRLMSLLSISLFFFAGNTNHSSAVKAFIIACIGLSSIILNYLYQKNKDVRGSIKILVLIEIIGNSFLLIPTGGLNSPFVWYSINTILIAAIMLGSLYCWINLGVYLFTSTCLVYFIFQSGEQSLLQFISRESNLMLSMVLITAIIRLLALYIKRLIEDGIKQTETNRQLNFANGKVRESINHIMELYQAVNMFTTLNDKEDIINTIMEYTGKIAKADNVFFYSCISTKKRLIFKGNKMVINKEYYLSSKLEETWEMIMNSPMPVEVDIENKKCLVAPIRSDCIIYGVLGIEVKGNQLNAYYMDYIDQLKFMSGLGSIVFEKFEMEQVNERLVITEEQNRIANEIHDNVQQRLFSTSFGIYSLMRNISNMTDEEINEELNLIRSSIDSAMKELRMAIYSMSWKKGGNDNFIADTMKFIEEIRRLNDVKISFQLIGNSDLLSLLQKKTLYRIICEGVGNAVRHGSAEFIEVSLNTQSDVTVLKIIDDGTGFDFQLLKQSKQGGMGIKNIEALAHYLEGKAYINSNIGKGTKIKITFPIFSHLHREEKIV